MAGAFHVDVVEVRVVVRNYDAPQPTLDAGTDGASADAVAVSDGASSNDLRALSTPSSKLVYTSTSAPTSTSTWGADGGSPTRTNRLEQSASGSGIKGWEAARKSRSLTTGAYCSIALTPTAVYAIARQAVMKLDAATGELLWEHEAFNPRGPMVVDNAGDAYISWTGSAKAAGFRKFAGVSGEQLYQTSCPSSGNYDYDVGAVAVSGDDSAGLVTTCRFWDSYWQSEAVGFKANPAVPDPFAWRHPQCAIAAAPLFVTALPTRAPQRRASVGDFRDGNTNQREKGKVGGSEVLAIVAGCTGSADSAVLVLSSSTGAKLSELKSSRSWFNALAFAVLAIPTPTSAAAPVDNPHLQHTPSVTVAAGAGTQAETPMNGSAVTVDWRSPPPQPPPPPPEQQQVVAVFFGDGQLCVYPLNPTVSSVAALGCALVRKHPVVGGTSTSITRARVMVELLPPSPSTNSVSVRAYVQGYSPKLRELPEQWWLNAVDISFSANPAAVSTGAEVGTEGRTANSGFVAVVTNLWGFVDGANGGGYNGNKRLRVARDSRLPMSRVMDRTVNMAWAFGWLSPPPPPPMGTAASAGNVTVVRTAATGAPGRSAQSLAQADRTAPVIYLPSSAEREFARSEVTVIDAATGRCFGRIPLKEGRRPRAVATDAENSLFLAGVGLPDLVFTAKLTFAELCKLVVQC
jgi:hypothetical protein